MRSKSEETLHLKICDYLRKNYPNVIFRTDFSSGMKMTPGQAAKHKKFQSSRAFPDLFIAAPSLRREIDQFGNDHIYTAHGLFLEIKADNTVIFKKNGEIRQNKHLIEQNQVLEKLRRLGYEARFVVGFYQTVQVIHNYLGKPKRKEVEF